MKLLTQGDDYGFTKGVTYGILDAIDNGVLRNTGMFTNMPLAPWAAERFLEKDRSEACLGIDFNLVSGPSVAPAESIPSLVDEEGEFIRSGVRVRDPRFQTEEGRRAMFPYEEVYLEVRAQYDRFVTLLGRKPGYLHGHSIMHEHYVEAIRQLSRETGVPFSMDLQREKGVVSSHSVIPMSNATTKKVFDPVEQLQKEPLADFLNHADSLLEHEYVSFGGHPGFVDAELLTLTTLSLERMKDHAAMVAPALKEWIASHGVKLITYRDLT